MHDFDLIICNKIGHTLNNRHPVGYNNQCEFVCRSDHQQWVDRSIRLQTLNLVGQNVWASQSIHMHYRFHTIRT